MYKSYWQMTMDPFVKEVPIKDSFTSEDFKQIQDRLKHLKKVRGIGVLTGIPGSGKTRAVRCFCDQLNPNLHRVVYTAVTNVSEEELFRNIAGGFGLRTELRKGSNIININERMRKLYKEQNILPVLIIDDAHCIKKPDFYLSLQSMMNFEMDSQDYALLILIGQPRLSDTLGLGVNESFTERVRINYTTQGMTLDEVKEYVRSRMLLAQAPPEIFDAAAVDAAYSCCQGSVRKLNRIMQTALLEGCNRKVKTVSTDIIMTASAEISVVK